MWWNLVSFREDEQYKENLSTAKAFLKSAEERWIPELKRLGGIEDGKVINKSIEGFKKALADLELVNKKVDGFGDYLARPISREDKIMKYLPVFNEVRDAINGVTKNIADLQHALVISSSVGNAKEMRAEIKSIELNKRIPDELELTLREAAKEWQKLPETVRREGERKAYLKTRELAEKGKED